VSESKATLDESQQGLTLDQKIHAEQVDSLYSQAPAAFVMELLIASFIGLSVREQVGDKTALFWWLFMVSFSALDFFGYIAYKSKPENYDKPYLWFKVFLVTVVLISSAWGFGGLYLITKLDLPYQIFMVTVMAMIAGASVTALSLRCLSLCLFLFFSLTPVIIWLTFFGGERVHVLIAGLLGPYAIALSVGGFQLSSQMRESLRLRFENEELASSLKNSNGRLQSLNQELTLLSATDPLTQVANRRYFEERLDKEWRRIVREQGEVAIIMIDVDHFKLYNDSLGHQQGDTCLTKVALSVRDSLRRPADIVARYGGEEFIVFLPNTTREGAVRVAEMIRENVINLDISHPSSETLELVSVSVGVGYCKPVDATKSRDLIAKADAALYAAKDAGRNRVLVKVLETT